MKEDQDYTFRRLDETMYKDLRYISRSAFGFDPGSEYYRQKNRTQDFGEPFLGYIAYSKTGEPAAFYGVYACPVEYQGKVYAAAQSGDTMTHKNHTGKGLFIKLAKLTYELAKEKGIHFIFGFPNQNSLPGFVRKLSWICPANLVEYRQNVFTLPLAKLAKKLTFLKGLYSAYVRLILSFYKADISFFVNSLVKESVSGISRSHEFIQYKSASGCRIIKINGGHIWIKADGLLQIGDLEKSLLKSVGSFNKKIRKLAFLLGTDQISFLASPGTVWDSALREIFSVRDSLAYGYLDLSGKFPLDTLQFTGADSDTF